MSNRIIKINRGDSLELPILVDILGANEAIYFALLCPHQKLEDALLIKGYDNTDQNIETGEILIKLTPNDTRRLSPGVYYYVVKFQRGGTLTNINDFDEPEEVRTIIERTKFIINE